MASNQAICANKLIVAAHFARDEFARHGEQIDAQRIAAWIETGIDQNSRKNCRLSYEYALVHCAQYLPDSLAKCAALALHTEGAQQRILVGTLAAAEKYTEESFDPFSL